MDEHLTRALYLGVTLFLIVAAFAAFFALYGDYQDYYSHASELKDFDRLILEERASEGPFIRGDEVVNLILEKKRADNVSGLQGLYAGTTPPEQPEGNANSYIEPFPEIYVNGENCSDIALGSVNPDDAFDADFTFDSSGKPLRVDLKKR